MKVKILLKSKVNISQLFKILPFVCVILLSGCSVLEESEGFISSQNTTNKDAARFIKTINNQPDQLSLYRNLLADYQPMYDLVKMKYGSEHGMYYFVPYCEPVSAEVKGAILIIILKVFNGGIKVVKYNREDSWGPIAYDITDNNELVRCK